MTMFSARVTDVSAKSSKQNTGNGNVYQAHAHHARAMFSLLFLVWATRCAFTWVGLSLSQHSHMNLGGVGFYQVSCALVTVFQILPAFLYSSAFVCKPLSHFMYYSMGTKLVHWESGIYLGSMIGFGIELIMRTFNGQCASFSDASIDFFMEWGCNPAGDLKLLPQDSALFVLFTPVILSALFPAANYRIALASQIISITAMVISLLLLDSTQSVWFGTSGMVVSSIALYSGVNVWALKVELPPMSKVMRRPINVKIPAAAMLKSHSLSNSPANSGNHSLTPVKSPVGNINFNNNSLLFSASNNNHNSVHSYSNHSKGTNSRHVAGGSGKSNGSGGGGGGGAGGGNGKDTVHVLSAHGSGTSAVHAGSHAGSELFNYDREMLEFKSLIANAAHDLKTPLTAFMNGIEMSGQVVDDMSARLGTLAKFFDGELLECYRALQEDLHVLTSTLHSMSNTNSFMLMSINRTIDFSKASNGIVLVPRPEPFIVRDVFLFAMNCVRDLNPHSNIQFSPIPEDITRNIVTDKQWLLDNLLCLVSNAVKFSPAGNVVRVSLQLRRRKLLPMTSSGKGTHNNPHLNEHGRAFSIIHRGSEIMSHRGSEVMSHRGSELNINFSHSGSVNSASGQNNATQILQRLSSRLPAGTVLERSLLLVNASADPDGGEKGVATHHSNGFSVHSAFSEGDGDMMVLVEVEDNGIGIIDEATRRSLFDGYQQTNRLSGGAGLGLYSLSLRMQALGGAFGCLPRKDRQQGSLFWFAFPYIPDAGMTDEFSYSFTSNNSGSTYRVTVPSLKPQWTLLGCESADSTDNTAADRSGDNFFHNMGTATTEHTQTTIVSQSVCSGCLDSARTSVSMQSTPSTTTRTLGGNSNTTTTANNTSIGQNPSSSSHNTLRILVVDDAPSILKMSSTMLKRKGYEVDTATNGLEAVTKIDNALTTSRPESYNSHYSHHHYGQGQMMPGAALHHGFDVVLMDLQMPIMDGLEAMRRIRQLEAERLAQYNQQLCDICGAAVGSCGCGGGSITAADVINEEDEAALEGDSLIIQQQLSNGSSTASSSGVGAVKESGGVAGGGGVIEEDIENNDGTSSSKKVFLSSKSPSFGSRLAASKASNAGSGLGPNRPPQTQAHGHQASGVAGTRRSTLFIVGVSACSDSETVEDAFLAGADVFIAKPFTIDSFHQATKQLREEMMLISSSSSSHPPHSSASLSSMSRSNAYGSFDPAEGIAGITVVESFSSVTSQQL